MTGPSSGAELRKHLDRWVAEGLIDTAQATRIETAETPATGSPAAGSSATGSRAPLVAEALGYAGGVLAIAAGLYLVRDFWPNLSTGAVLAFAAAACAALGAGGAAVRATSDPALRRLRSVLWLLSTVSLAAFAGTLADQVWGFGPASTTLVTAAVSAAYGAAGGAILAFRIGLADPELVYWTQSGQLVFMAVLGGFSNFFGPIIGALAFTLLQDQLQSLTQYWRFILGAVLAVIVIGFPGGLAGLADDLHWRRARNSP